MYTGFKAEIITRERGSLHHDKNSTHENTIIILNLNTPNDTVSTYIKQNLTELPRRKWNNSIIKTSGT